MANPVTRAAALGRWVMLLIGAWLALAAGALPAVASTAPSKSSTEPSLELRAFKVVAVKSASGTAEKLVPAAEARAGDVLEYQAVYTNPTPKTVHDVQVTLPVPTVGVEFLLESTQPAAQTASTDGKRYAALPLKRTEKLPDGRQVQRPSPGSDYHFLRWSLGDLPAGAVRVVSARVQLTASPGDIAAR